MAQKLTIGDLFPTISMEMVDGGTITLPGDLSAKYKVILFYRGHW
jgi:peroxiredoxin